MITVELTFLNDLFKLISFSFAKTQLTKIDLQPYIINIVQQIALQYKMTTENTQRLKIRDKHRIIRRSPLIRGQIHSLVKRDLRSRNNIVSEVSQLDQNKYSLPPIHMKDPFAQSNEQVRTSLHTNKNKRSPKSTLRILQLIEKEMILSRKDYFQTISSDRALIIKNKMQKKDASLFFHRYQQSSQISLLTPKLKQYPNSSYGRLPAIVKGREVILSARQTKWHEQYSPWGISQAEEPS